MSYPRIFEKVYADLWCITPEAWSAIDDTLQRHLLGNRMDQEAYLVDVSKAEKKPLTEANASQGFGILTINGVIGKRLSSLESMCGGCDLNDVLKGAAQLAANPAVGTIIMDISSPGGVVTGVPEAYSALCEIAQQKTLIAYTDTQMCSAAYWLASAAHSIYSAPTATVGSIGVYVAVLDQSKALAKKGINVQAVQAGKYKTDGAPWKPLTEDAQARIQARVDEVYNDFKTAVTTGRGAVDDETMQGQTFRGKQALAMNLVDGNHNSLDALVKAIVDRRA